MKDGGGSFEHAGLGRELGTKKSAFKTEGL